jgi:hypothetical protein
MDQLYRSLLAVDPNTNFPISTNYILSTDGIGNISWQNSLYNLSSYGQEIGYLPSTINMLTVYMSNISTGVLPGSLSTPNLTSTVDGLGTVGYISSQSFYSTITGLGSLGYISSALLGSTVTGLGTFGYISTLNLYSTIQGLGTYGYISSSTLRSSIVGLGSLGYVSSLSLRSSLVGLGNLGYVSSSQLQSTVEGLGFLAYVSTASLVSTTNQLTLNMISSVTDILDNNTNFYLNQANALVIAGNNVSVYISTLSSAFFYDSFYNSSIKYTGCNNSFNAFSNTDDLFISSLDLQLSNFSNYIHDKSQITIDIYPNIILPSLDPGWNPKLVHVSTSVAYSNQFLRTHNTKYIVQHNNSSNLFQQPIRLNLYGSDISNYSNRYQVLHRFVNIINYAGSGGIGSNNVSLAFDSTTSYYLSIQNITY